MPPRRACRTQGRRARPGVRPGRAQVDGAKVDLEKAQRNFQRLDNLKAGAAFSQTERDDAESAVKSAAARLESVRQQYELLKAGTRQEQIDAQQAVVAQLEGTLAMATLDLTNTAIRAPVDSTVLERNVEVGEFVTNGFVGRPRGQGLRRLHRRFRRPAGGTGHQPERLRPRSHTGSPA